jgi:uncharacterized protein with LGFP repeats
MTLIDRKYQELGGEQGFLGRPVGPERGTPDGRGHFRHFEGGSIYATLQTDAHEVHGAIRDKWQELEWERGILGFPVTDEMPTPDGRGRFNHFEHGSIYWTPETGAHEVHGAIRDKWAELEWERGFLGYPVTDERPTPDGRGRYSRFEGGSIHWTPEGGAQAKRRTEGPSCSISGRAYGPGAGQARVFRVSLYGPNNLDAHRETRPFDASGRYAFTGLPRGRYRLTVTTKADLLVGPHPPRIDVDCRGGAEGGIDFELR